MIKKNENRKKLIENLKNFNYSFAKISKYLGISKQRTWQILNEEHVKQRRRNSKKKIQKFYLNVYIRDKWVYVKCSEENDLLVHHIDGDISNNNIKNLQILCRKCHGKKHGKDHGKAITLHKKQYNTN